MRKYQISIKLSLFDDPDKPCGHELRVYTDGNDLLGTISASYYELINAIVHSGKLSTLPFVAKFHEWR